jgi:glycosyltransferase involved in cell wall biosynthesis
LRKIPTSIGEILPARYFEKRTAVETRGKEIVISTARLDVQKDHVTLLRAFKIVANKIPNSELWLVGDGPLKNQLKSLAEKLGISQRVKFFGWVQNPTKLLDSSKVFVLSTKWEGLPLSILEAMAGGIPVVASNCNYGPSEIIGKNKYGILVPVGNSNALAEAIVKLLSDGTKRKHYSNMAKIRAADFLQEKILTKYIKILEELFNIRYNRPDTFISEI